MTPRRPRTTGRNVSAVETLVVVQRNAAVMARTKARVIDAFMPSPPLDEIASPFLCLFRLSVNTHDPQRCDRQSSAIQKIGEGFYKLFAIFLQPSIEMMSLVSIHSLILLVRTETEG